jgi:hypothetical protein
MRRPVVKRDNGKTSDALTAKVSVRGDNSDSIFDTAARGRAARQ